MPKPATIETPEVVFCLADPEPFAALAVGTARPDGNPVKRYRKELIREGRWTHPTTGQEVYIDLATLGAFVQSFTEMQEVGRDVPIKVDHDPKSDNAAGWLEAVDLSQRMYRGELVWALYGTMQLGDAKAAQVDDGSLRHVSIKYGRVVDGLGHEWAPGLQEVSLTQLPVIEDQEGFTRLSYTQPTERHARREEGDSMTFGKKPAAADGAPSAEEIKLAEVSAKLEALEARNAELAEQVQARDTELAATNAAKVADTKGAILAKIDGSETAPPALKEAQTAIVERAFGEDIALAEAEEWAPLLDALADAIALGPLPKGKKVDGDDVDPDEPTGAAALAIAEVASRVAGVTLSADNMPSGGVFFDDDSDD